MQIDLRSIDEHAARRLADDLKPTDRLNAFKRFLKLETQRLRFRHRFGLGGVEIATGRSYLVDVVVRRVCQIVAAENGMPLEGPGAGASVVALGGYGRRELAPHSDVDLLFLREAASSAQLEAVVEQVLMMLWDVGLTVGHSFRSLEECLAMAKGDLHSRNAMAEARLVAGSGELYETLMRRLRQAVFGGRRQTMRYLEEVKQEWLQRRERYGKVVCVLEPNVKEGAGGLRDLHTILWLGQLRFGCRGLGELASEGLVSEAEHAAARRAYDFVSRTRNEAHFAAGRASDQLLLPLQPTLAAGLGYVSKRGLLASEIFMREYYGRAQELLATSEGILERFWAPRRRRLPWRPRPVGRRRDLEIREGRLEQRGDPALEISDPHWLLEVFEAAQQTDMPLGPELKQTVRDRLRLINRRFRSSGEAGRAFLRMLGRPGRVASTLRKMHDAGFLGRLLPEWGYITFLVQHDYYHKYTIDEHTLEAVAALDQLTQVEEGPLAPLASVLEEVERPEALYLGLLLHDIGKGRGGGHVEKGVDIADRLCRRLELEDRLRDDVLFLVRCHLLMSQTSQRRDLSEEKPIQETVSQVGTLDRLNQLLLLTYADNSGIGPGVWNEWKSALLWELYTRARERLDPEHREPAGRAARRSVREQVLDRPPAGVARSEVERHYALLPERYERTTGRARLERHLRLVRGLADEPLQARWKGRGAGRPDELTVCTRDAPGLLARLAGTLTAHGLNILHLDLYTREDGIVLDTFQVASVAGLGPLEEDRRQAVERSLKEAVEGRYDVEQAIVRWRANAQLRGRSRRRPVGPSGVVFDTEASATRTLIEVRADDEPGLVHSIATTLAEKGMTIEFAKVATAKTQALDTFYITSPGGQKLDEGEMRMVEDALLRTLDPTRGEGDLQ